MWCCSITDAPPACVRYDTDCHGDFERIYIELEQLCFNEQQMYDPGNVSRTPKDVLQDAVAAWKTFDHSKAVSGHKKKNRS